MELGYSGDLVRLVAFDRERHFENLYRWINDPDVTAGLLIDGPVTREFEEEWFQSAAKGSSKERYFAIETLDGEHIGTSAFHGIDYANGHCHSGSYIGRKDLWGNGYGTDAVRVRAAHGFHIMGLRQLYSSVLEGNEASLKMQLKAGYEIVGMNPKKFWKRGMYRDETVTLLTREKWLSTQK